MGRTAHSEARGSHTVGLAGTAEREGNLGVGLGRPRPQSARGLSARLVQRRESQRRRREAIARLRAWAILLTHREPLGITVDGEAVETRVLVVANNAYGLDFPSLGTRERLDEGALHLYVPGD